MMTIFTFNGQGATVGLHGVIASEVEMGIIFYGVFIKNSVAQVTPFMHQDLVRLPYNDQLLGTDFKSELNLFSRSIFSCLVIISHEFVRQVNVFSHSATSFVVESIWYVLEISRTFFFNENIHVVS